MRFSELADQPCSISRSLSVLGERWTLIVLKQAFAGTRRFDDFVATTGISRSPLAAKLAALVDHGLLETVEYRNGRTRLEYRLTQRGHDVYPILMALRDWGDIHLSPDGPPIEYRHTDCGGKVQLTLNCEKCDDELHSRAVTATLGPGFEPTTHHSHPTSPNGPAL